MFEYLRETDVCVYNCILKEKERQNNTIELIASENFTSKAVMEAQGSVLTNKYAEGYPNKRYYGGCENVDTIEQLAIDRLRSIYGAEHANVQPHSGSQANMAVYMSILEPDDKVLGMNLSHGGHLTHGHPVNFSGKNYNFISYGVNREGFIDYDEVERIALLEKPKLIVAGASAYPRIIDFSRFREIAHQVGAYFMVDMAHIAGLVAAGLHPNPVFYADFVTSTTHKTLRGPRGGFILCKKEFANKIDKSIFPGIQGGPLMHVIAGKAVAFKEASTKEFIEYQKNVIDNAYYLSEYLKEKGFKLVSDGTDNHLMLIDLTGTKWNGKTFEEELGKHGITVNKNQIPYDTLSPMLTSGIRIGTAAVTTRGFEKQEMKEIADIMYNIFIGADNKDIDLIVKQMCERHSMR